MNRNIKFSEFNNPARIFGGLLKDLEDIANERDLPVQDVIRMFIVDLQNMSNENYEKKLPEMCIKGDISPVLKKKFLSFLNKAIKSHNKTLKNNKERKKQADRKQELENIWKTIKETLIQNDGKSIDLDSINELLTKINEGTAYAELKKECKSYISKKLNELAEKEKRKLEKEREKRKLEKEREKRKLEEEREERKLEEEREKRKLEEEKAQRIESTNKKWEEIVKIVDKASANTGKSKLELWEAISESLFGENKNSRFDLEISEGIKENIKTLIYDRIKLEGAEYYEAVKKYTQNFEFLTAFRGITFAASGHKSFGNPQHSKMFEELVSTLRKSKKVEYPEGEEELLNRVLKENIVKTYYGEKIIKARLNRIKASEKFHKTNNNQFLRE